MYLDQYPDMRTDGYLSVWVGVSESVQKLEALLHTSFETDIDGIAPWIEEAFEIVGYDEDFSEIAYSKFLQSPVKLVLMTYFGHQLTDLINLSLEENNPVDVNSLVIAGNLKYDGHIRSAKTESTSLTFIGFYQVSL
jgi:hypothetical protein